MQSLDRARKCLATLADSRTLSAEEYKLVLLYESELSEYAGELARNAAIANYGHDIFIRGLIEVGNICRNDCLYCGIRRSNPLCERYVLTKEQILQCCQNGYALGFRTFVLQGGEGCIPVASVCDIVAEIRKLYPDCAITLSLGEYSRTDYEQMFAAGANRYLLRHETATEQHYRQLHPANMTLKNRMRCLQDLRSIGFQTGCGFMVGSPYQTVDMLASELKFIEEFQPDMCGIGPFIPQKDTPFAAFPPGSAGLTVFLLSLIRLIKPNILLPATTALATVSGDGRIRGILAGANVVMPNLSPLDVRKKYALYDNKAIAGGESAQGLAQLQSSMESIGYHIVSARGDIKK